MTVFITRNIPLPGIELLQQAGIGMEVWMEKRELTPAELIEKCKKHDGLLSVGTNEIDASFLLACSHLKVIALLSAGYNRVDVEEASRLKIPVGNTPGVISHAAADIAFLLMIATARQAFYHHKKIINGEWGFFEPTVELGLELHGKTLGVFGLGSIGMEMARRCVGAYKMKVIYCNRSANTVAEEELNATKVSFDELLGQSDVLSVHCLLSPQTKGKFNKPAFEKMKRQAIFINTARGALHNESDLLWAIQNNIIWGAGLDVTDPEPMSADNPLLQMPTVSVLPHIGSATFNARNAMATIAAQNIIAGLQGKSLPHIVNPQVYQP